jgi:Uma2 family endonuclease
VSATGLYTYPDVAVVCGKPELERPGDTLCNPKMIVEVLSESTEAYDRGEKFSTTGHQSMTDFVLVSQTSSS